MEQVQFLFWILDVRVNEEGVRFAVDVFGCNWEAIEAAGFGCCDFSGEIATKHHSILSALDHRALCYLNKQSYDDLQDDQLLSKAIDETRTIPAVSCEDGDDNSVQIERQRIDVEQNERDQIRGITDYLIEVHGIPL